MSQAPGQKVGSYDNEKPHLCGYFDNPLHLESAVTKRGKPNQHSYCEGCS